MQLVPYDGPLPILAGASPFQIKGLSYLTMIDEANEHVAGGFAAVRATLHDPVLVRFFEQTFLAMSYYDALPVLPLSIALSRVRAVSYADGVRSRTERRVQQDLQIYRTLLRTLSPDQVFAGLLRIWPRYFAFGKVGIENLGPKHWEVRLDELPALLVPWFMVMLEGYVCAVLRAAGVESPKVAPLPVTGLPPPPSLELVNIRVDVSWY